MHRIWFAMATFVAMLFFVAPAFALEPPKLVGRVNDYADVLSEADEARIGRMLESHEKATGQQFAVLTIPSLEGDSLERFSIETVEAWKLGREKEDDGLLLLVARDDHKVRIEVGRGLEGSITDAVSSRIIRGILVPAFKKDDYSGGIERALGALIALETKGVADIPEEPPERQSDRQLPAPLALFLLIFMFGVPILLARWGGWGGGGRGGFGGRSGGFGGWYGGY
ncbi:MAG TPA: TPM domain-containing protein, partial [Polyangiaceae bacterium]